VRSAESIILLCLLLFFGGTEAVAGIQDEQGSLLEQQKTLQGRVAVLKQEQDFLLFQKEMAASDSRYLVLNLAAKKGQLWYKNRVLKDFHLILSNNVTTEIPPAGILKLTKKTEGTNGRYVLQFGKALIMQWKRASVPPREADIPFISLTKKEIQAVYFAVEPGAMAYIVR
jgi:hypothetical protein